MLMLKSFVKLDSLVYISVSEVSKCRLMANGDTLDQMEISAILKLLSL